MPRKYNPWSRQEYDTLEALINEGLSDSAIAARMGRGYNSIRSATQRLALCGVRTRKRLVYGPRVDTLIRACIEVEAMSVPQIVERITALGYPASRCWVHSRIASMPDEVHRTLIKNAKARRAKLRGIKARRRAAQEKRAA